MNKNNNLKYYVDENVIRIIAAQIIIITAVSLWQNWFALLLLLAIDFALRAFTYLPSPLAATAKIIADLLKLKPKPIFAAPKKFAAVIGFFFTTAIFTLVYLQLYIPASLVGSVLILFALLESVFRICAGCYVYDCIVAPIVNNRNNKAN